jgi:hypothetical protein
MSVLEYMQPFEPAANAAQLSELLNLAGSCNHLAVAQWLRQHAAEWPTELRFDVYSWSGDVLQWARDEGCTSPTTTDATADA